MRTPQLGFVKAIIHGDVFHFDGGQWTTTAKPTPDQALEQRFVDFRLEQLNDRDRHRHVSTHGSLRDLAEAALDHAACKGDWKILECIPDMASYGR